VRLGVKAVELRRPNGEKFILPMTRLSKSSQERAIQWATATLGQPTLTNWEPQDPELLISTVNPFEWQAGDYVVEIGSAAFLWLTLIGMYYLYTSRRGLTRWKAFALLIGAFITYFGTYFLPPSLGKLFLQATPLLLLCFLDLFSTKPLTNNSSVTS
jgi:hypothetical protein